MEGFVDVHAHAVPSGDDGARSIEEAVELCGLARLLEEGGRSGKDPKPPGGEQALRAPGGAEAQALVAGKRERPAQALLELASLLASAREQASRSSGLTAHSSRRRRAGRRMRSCAPASPQPA